MMLEKIRASVAKGVTVPMCFIGHQLVITRVGSERVHFINPHGSEESMPISRFQSPIVGADILLA